MHCITEKFRHSSWRILIGALAIAVATTTAATSAEDKAAEAPATAQVGKPAPDFTLLDQAGVKQTLSAYRGKVVVLEWFNPGCPFVKRHYTAKTMTDLQKKYGSDKLVWLRVNSTNKDHRDYLTDSGTTAWLVAEKVTGPSLSDADGAVGRLYGAKTTPHMFIVDQAGLLVYSGSIDNDPRGSLAADKRVNYVDLALTSWKAGKDIPPTANDPYGCGVKYKQ